MKSEIEEKIKKILVDILKDKGINKLTIDNDDSLYEDGLGLDSMDTAIFSAMLENELGKDPYSSNAFPRKVHEVINFYQESETE